MAQEAHQAPVGRSRRSTSSSTSPATGMWESPPQMMQAHTPFPSWIPSYASTFAAAAGAGPAAVAASSLQSEHGPHHAWNDQNAPRLGPHGGSGGYRGNFLSLLEAKNVTPEMFEDVPAAACDYLGGVGTAAAAAATSNMAGLAAAAAFGLGSSVDPYSTAASSAPPSVKHETASLPSPPVYSGDSSVVHGGSMGCMPCYDHEEKPPADSQRQGFGAPTAAFLQQIVPTSRVELQSVLGYSGMVSERLESSFGVGSLPGAGSFSDYNSSRSSADFMSSNSNSNRHEQDIRPGMGSSSSGRSGGAATSAATRRKSEEGVGGNTKKSKREASNNHKASPPKPQAPKVKLGEKITALQQIVSPFGKTDTSSVLFETIEYIKFLHEQIRLFSEPYMTKSTYSKGHTRRRAEEKEEESGTTGHDMRGRGLCLVPVSLTSQAYHDDTLTDCWAPAYRSCLYP